MPLGAPGIEPDADGWLTFPAHRSHRRERPSCPSCAAGQRARRRFTDLNASARDSTGVRPPLDQAVPAGLRRGRRSWGVWRRQSVVWATAQDCLVGVLAPPSHNNRMTGRALRLISPAGVGASSALSNGSRPSAKRSSGCPTTFTTRRSLQGPADRPGRPSARRVAPPSRERHGAETRRPVDPTPDDRPSTGTHFPHASRG